MKLCKTSNMDIVKYCQHCFSFDMPSDPWEKRARTFGYVKSVNFVDIYRTSSCYRCESLTR